MDITHSFGARTGVLGLCAVLVATTLAGCENREAAAPRAPRSVSVVAPEVSTVQRYLYATGTTKAVNRVALVARVAGRLMAAPFTEGREVQAGATLFQIEPDLYRAQVQQAEANVAQAQANAENTQRQLERQEQLARSSVASDAALDTARTNRDAAKAQLAAAEASLTQAHLNLGYATITAPFSGVMTERAVDVGAFVAAGTTLATIVQLDPIHVSLAVADSDVLAIRKAMRARGLTPKDAGRLPIEVGTQADADYPYRGRLDYISPETSANAGTFQMRAVFDNHDRALLPGLFVRLRVPIEDVKDALLVPASAIGTDQEGRYVLAVNARDQVERRAVVLLDGRGTQQHVRGALTATDRVIANVRGTVRPGDTVRIRPQTEPAAAAN